MTDETTAAPVASSPPPSRRRLAPALRWGTLACIAVLVAAGWSWIWILGDRMRQQQVMQTLLLGFVTLVLLLVWTVLCSGLRRRARMAIIATVALLAGAAAASLRVRGVSGDLVPILTWRWSEEPAAAVAPATPAAPTTTVELAGLADYPQFLGPDRRAVLAGLDLARDWSASPPREVWRTAVGPGWSGFAVSGRRAVTQEQAAGDELVVCRDVADGTVLWVRRDAARYDSTMAGVGPRATPTITDDAVYAMGATGLLNALALADGRSLWTVDVMQDNGASIPDWGCSGSPLVTDDLVVVNAGGTGGRSLVAYDRATGERVWSAGSDEASYASPELMTLAGRAQIVMVNRESVTGHDPGTGVVLWTFSWPGRTPKVAQPLQLTPGSLLVSAGYGLGCAGLAIEPDDDGGLAVRALWRSRALKAKFTNVVHHEGLVYGLDDGVLTCIDPTRGRRQWKDGRYGHGQLVLVDDLLLIQAENGDVVLVEASPVERRELTRFAALDDKTWNTPALAGRYLLVRNDLEAACYELPAD
jgi:outer membrane protein assembly factor BamB